MKEYTLWGYVNLIRLSAAKLWQAVFLLVYSLFYGITSLVRWLWRCLIHFVATYPKAFVCIVCGLFILNNVMMHISYRMNAEEQNIRFDSLWHLKDSVERYSLYDSGYARGLHDANILIKDNTDGLKEKEDSIHRP